MVLIYMVCHGSHQYTSSHVSINIPAPWILWVCNSLRFTMEFDPAHFPCCVHPMAFPRLSSAGAQGLQVPLHQHIDLEGVGPITRRGNLEGEATHAVPGRVAISVGFNDGLRRGFRGLGCRKTWWIYMGMIDEDDWWRLLMEMTYIW